MKKIISFLLCVVMAASMLSACGGSKNANNKNSKETSQVSSQAAEANSWQAPTEGSGGISLPIVKDPMTVNYMFYEVAAMAYKDTWLVFPELAKRTNIIINP